MNTTLELSALNLSVREIGTEALPIPEINLCNMYYLNIIILSFYMILFCFVIIEIFNYKKGKESLPVYFLSFIGAIISIFMLIYLDKNYLLFLLLVINMIIGVIKLGKSIE